MILALDTATTQVAVAIGDPTPSAGVVRGEVRLVGGRRHAEQLAPAISALSEWTGVELAQLTAVAVGIGPGLFTGLRVGVTTAKVLAQALRIPIVAIPSLDLVAYRLRHARSLVVAVLDARRREVFHASYRPVPGGVQRVSDYSVGSAAELAADLEAAGEDVLLAGDGVTRYRDTFATIDRAAVAGADFAAPSVAALVELAMARIEREEFDSPLDVRPLYLRDADVTLADSGPFMSDLR